MAGNKYLTVGVLQHVEQTVGGIVVVQWHVGTTALLDTDGGHQELLLVSEHDADEVVGQNAQCHQFLCECSGIAIELCIGVGALFVDDGSGVRCRCGLLHEQRRESLRGIARHRLALRPFYNGCGLF